MPFSDDIRKTPTKISATEYGLLFQNQALIPRIYFYFIFVTAFYGNTISDINRKQKNGPEQVQGGGGGIAKNHVYKGTREMEQL